MQDGEGWLLRPVNHHLCSYESLKDGSVDLADIARMNESIDVDNENRIRLTEWAEQNG